MLFQCQFSRWTTPYDNQCEQRVLTLVHGRKIKERTNRCVLDRVLDVASSVQFSTAISSWLITSDDEQHHKFYLKKVAHIKIVCKNKNKIAKAKWKKKHTPKRNEMKWTETKKNKCLNTLIRRPIKTNPIEIGGEWK